MFSALICNYKNQIYIMMRIKNLCTCNDLGEKLKFAHNTTRPPILLIF